MESNDALFGWVGMINKQMCVQLHNARKRIAEVLLLNYPEAEDICDLPQKLVQAFEIITLLLQDAGYRGPAAFKFWWNYRTLPKEKMLTMINNVGNHWLELVLENPDIE